MPPARSPARWSSICSPASFRERWNSKGIPLGHTRIGAHAGAAVVGNFGGKKFFDYSAYGDTINVAARLEAANKTLGTRICVSGALPRVKDLRGRPVGDLLLRGGRADPCVRAAGRRNRAGAGRRPYIEAFEKLEAGDPGAMAAFAAMVGKAPGGLLASFHLEIGLHDRHVGALADDELLGEAIGKRHVGEAVIVRIAVDGEAERGHAPRAPIS